MTRFPDDVPTLTDGVVTLRAHREDDVPALLEQAIDPVTVAWTTVPVPSTEETSRDYATGIVPAGWRDDTSWAFAVEAVDGEGACRFAGTVELRDRGERRAEIAFGAHPWARGRGVLERACRLLLDWGFNEHRLETVVWWAHRGNWASRRLAWRLGFDTDAAVRHWQPQRGALLDAWVGVLLAGDPREPRTPWLDCPRIDGPTVTLRPFRADDAPRVVEACRDEQTSYWLANLPAPYDTDDALAYVAGHTDQLAEGRGITWAVTRPGADAVVGSVGVFDLAPGRHAEVGYWTHPEARGHGVMTAAVRLVVRHAFVPEEDGGLGLRRLVVMHAEGNTASRRVIERNGFTRVGRDREGTTLRDGRVVDTIRYDLLASELRA